MKTTYDGKTITFNPYDTKGNMDLMSRASELDKPLFGKNEDGESVLISVNKDNITVETFQDNGWVRQNVYWEDGTTEELYRK